ncbi:MAG TPA: hypothetical protein VGM50_01550 [Gemmatimonadaceae bacterium]|jgi:hypothetical protein
MSNTRGEPDRSTNSRDGIDERNDPDLGERIGETTGGLAGVFLGAGIGSAAGPMGALIGGVAGAIGGWWAGRSVADAAAGVSHSDEAHFRAHYDSVGERRADRNYDDVRGAYYLGQIASHNPNFTGREFVEIEPELERGWAGYAERYGSWITVRDYAEEGFSRGTSRLDETARRARAEQQARTLGERDETRS